MKYTLLEMVQKVLSSIDSEEVNSISDSVEALQVSSILEDQYFLMVSNRIVPEHKEMIKLTAASDSNFPTHLRYPTGVSKLENLWYSTDASFTYKELIWLEPKEFVYQTDKITTNYTSTTTKVGGTALRVGNNKQPTYFTSFDDDWIVLDSHDAAVDSTIQSAKTRAYVIKLPTWSPHDDDFTPDMDDQYFSLLLQEAKVVATEELKGGPSQVADRAATRIRNSLQNKKRKVPNRQEWSTYGRK